MKNNQSIHYDLKRGNNSSLTTKHCQARMLPEPDLFSSVNINTHNPSDGVLSVLADTNTNTIPDLTHLCENDKSESPKQNIKQCHPYTWGINKVLSNGHQTNSNSSVKSRNQGERIARRWYLTVIVLLYVGLVTSFCLNVTLLMKSYPEPLAPRINPDTNKIDSDSKGS